MIENPEETLINIFKHIDTLLPGAEPVVLIRQGSHLTYGGNMPAGEILDILSQVMEQIRLDLIMEAAAHVDSV